MSRLTLAAVILAILGLSACTTTGTSGMGLSVRNNAALLDTAPATLT